MEKRTVTKDNRDIELKKMKQRQRAFENECIARAYMDWIERHKLNNKKED